jgi:PhnB protein
MEKKVPEGYQRIMPYLLIQDVEGLIRFMQDIFGAEEKLRHVDDDGRIRHAEITLGDSTVMIGGATEEWTAMPASLFIYVDDVDSAFKKAIEAGAKSIIDPADKEYGRTCGVEDRWGVTWWITSPL